MNNYIVYKHIFPNKKVYIGITYQQPEKRWLNGKGYQKNSYMQNAIQKYGWHNVDHKILYTNLTKEQAEEMEIKLISEYKSNQRRYGYNIANGGVTVGKMAEETKEKIRQTKIGEKNPMFGKNGTLNHNAKKIEQYDENGNYIRSWDYITEVERTLGFNMKGISNCLNDKTRSAYGFQWKYSDSNKKIEKYDGNINCGKKIKVNQYTIDGKLIKIWDGITEAEKNTGAERHGIVLCCKNKRKSQGGFRWQYYCED